MNRGVTLAGYGALAVAAVLLEVSARRARRKHRVPRPLTFAELVAVVRRSHLRWLLLAGWLWTGWHLFAAGPLALSGRANSSVTRFAYHRQDRARGATVS